MTKFDRYVEKLARQGEKRRAEQVNAELQQSLREKTERQVYREIYDLLGTQTEKRSAVLV